MRAWLRGTIQRSIAKGGFDVTEVLLFHHIQGLTDGVAAFADDLRASGHTVHTPDLFDGRTFDSIEEGFVYAQELGDATDAKANSAAGALPEALVYAGFSWGVGPAQRLAQTRPGARGAMLYEACYPITGEYAFGPWPDGVPVQIHGKEDDQFFAHEGDIDAARELVAKVGPELGELFVYPGGDHLFLDRSLPTYDADAAALVSQRSLQFLSVL
jgi:dienelactone hydrolase